MDTKRHATISLEKYLSGQEGSSMIVELSAPNAQVHDIGETGHAEPDDHVAVTFKHEVDGKIVRIRGTAVIAEGNDGLKHKLIAEELENPVKVRLFLDGSDFPKMEFAQDDEK